ncbi:succinate-semialdehyde dehydrogenase / glutarate-semialdehyde dehydrogenase [Marinobacter sp. es.048]|uniref:NAD-dependent succinate-semialdehyde dehydrogenase n=1 Tax=Marinobacter sp. es.048 TaxID=1761795 RepID=UPI000B58BBA1|nr:NAD-dependent succinate-semialdehyde dehydrogenase [Marinobacter sp. es.048]SNC74669.1 succinate-semialdehyde dehydrogenase / glutarate-semialdehyde dehydrogenase [Marinobacter sp. es.048]
MTLNLNQPTLFRDRAFIDGQWVQDAKARTFPVFNPSTGANLASVPDLGPEETRAAIDAAEKALKSWQALTAKERAACLRNWFNLIVTHQDDLASIMTSEQGKPFAEAKGEVAYGASFVEWFAEEAKRIYGDVIPAHGPDKRLVTIKQPIGVVAAITPWNFPIAMITRKVAPALAAGCTVVIKPGEDTPLCALALAELSQQAGIPAGVLNVITTLQAPEVGRTLCEDSRVRKLSFTGSTPVGKLLMRQCADTVKKVSLELGGNAPFIVFDDADVDAAISGLMASKFRNAGQTCVCTNRILVQDGVHDIFVEKLNVAIRNLKVGDGFGEAVTIGPLINDKAANKVLGLVEDALTHGARVTQQQDVGMLDNPNFYPPTVLTGVTASMRIAQEEIFGPVATIFRFTEEAEAVALANDTPFGLAAYFYSRDIGRVWRVAEALEYGMVGINEGLISTEVAPFGGIKESGIGREGSRYGIDDFVEIKYLCMGGL